MAIDWTFSSSIIPKEKTPTATPLAKQPKPATTPQRINLNSNQQSIYDPSRNLDSRKQSIYYNNTNAIMPDMSASNTQSAESTTTGGGGGWYFGNSVGGGGNNKIKWKNRYSVPNAPTWWQGLVPSVYDANTSYLALVNSMIPSMSPEDQQSTATYLATSFPDAFKMYSPETMTGATPAPNEITTPIRQQFTSADRANQTLATLDKLVNTISAQTGTKTKQAKKALGSGYDFLRSVVDTLKNYGGQSAENQQTRRQYLNQGTQLDPLLALAKSGTLSAFAPIANQLVNPTFTAGQLNQLTSTGKFGNPNKNLFG